MKSGRGGIVEEGEKVRWAPGKKDPAFDEGNSGEGGATRRGASASRKKRLTSIKKSKKRGPLRRKIDARKKERGLDH